MSDKTIFFNGSFYTYDRRYRHAQAIAVEDGQITEIGGNAKIRTLIRRGYKAVDLKKSIVMPGITDSHLHLSNLGLNFGRVNLDGVDSLKKVSAILRKAASKLKPGQWLLGRGWNKNLWGGAFPDKSILDEITNHPVALSSKDGHLFWVNSAALKIFRIDRWSPDPEGGVIDKDEHGEPTGILKENVINHVEKMIPEPTFDERKDAILLAQKHLLSMGITGVGECDTQKGLFGVYHELDRTAELKLRVFKMLSPEKLERSIDFKFKTGIGTEHLRTGCLKLFADGALGSQTAYMFEPYEGSVDNFGVETLDPVRMEDLIKHAFGAGISVAVHAIGDRANHQTLKAIGKYRRTAHGHNLRPRIEHAQVLKPDDIALFSRYNIIASAQPIHATSDRDTGDHYWGDRSAYAYPFRSFLRNRIIVAFGSDAPIETADPLAGLYAAVTRRRPNENRRGWHPEQCLTLHEAARCYTAGSAYACCFDDIAGSISVGKRADLIILSENIFKAKPEAILQTKIMATVIDGQAVHGNLP